MRPGIRLVLITTFLAFSACAGKPKRELDLSECISDPASKGFQCSGVGEATGFFLPYEKSKDYIARHPLTDQAFWEACFLQKKGMKK